MALIMANELQQFYQFVGCQLEQDPVGMSPEECLDIWRVQHPSPEELADSVAAIRTALEEARRGEGQPADEVISCLSGDPPQAGESRLLADIQNFVPG